MFSVPESIEIRAPADSANHSTGTDIRSARSSAAMIRAHSGLGHRAQRPGRVTEQHHAGDALGVPVGRRAWRRPATMPALLPPGARSTGTRGAVRVEVVLDEGAAGPASIRVSS